MSQNNRHYAFQDQAQPFWAEPHPVVVVGGGPVGLTAALGLVRRGVPTVILEAGDSVSDGSRAICTSRHSLEVFDRLNMCDLVQNDSLAWSRGRSFYREEEVLNFEMPSTPENVRPAMVNISQAVIEQHLIDVLMAEPLATILFESTVTGVKEHADAVDLRVGTPAGERSLTAQWVVAADGARSEVRSQLGLRLAGTSYEGRYIIADIHWKSQWPTERKVWFDPASNPGSTIIMHEQPGDIWRVDYQLDDGEDGVAEARPENIRARINRHFEWLGMPNEEWTLEWSSLYRAHALSLDSYRHGRVLFAGDAAHLVPIFGVRGLNSGVEDASTLSWTLAAVVRGTGRQELLDVYAAERRDAWEQNIASAKLSTLFMTPGTVGYRTSRQAVLAIANERPVFRNLINPRQSSATHARGSALSWTNEPAPTSGIQPGDPVPDLYLDEGKSRTLVGVGGSGFVVLGGSESAKAASDIVAALSAAFPQEGAAAVVLDDSGRKLLASTFGTNPHEVFIIRPEGLLLTRLDAGVPVDVAAIVGHLRAGGTVPAGGSARGRTGDAQQLPGQQAEGQTTADQEIASTERAWKGLSDALDAVPVEEHTVFLTRLALLLAHDHPDSQRVHDLMALAQKLS